MARIRSTHPTQWTDAEFVSCSPLARLLALALRNEADDQGIFEWKPIDLKIRLLPMDQVDVAALLGELVETRQVARFVVKGRAYGAIRNFTKFQKPKSPKPIHPLPAGGVEALFVDEVEAFPQNGETAAVEPPVVPQPEEPLPPNGEKSPQMEDGGGVGEGSVPKATPSGAAAPAPAPLETGDRPIDLKAELWRRGKVFLAKHGIAEARAGPMLGQWRRDHGDAAVIDALAAAEAEAASDIVPFINGRLRKRNGNDSRTARQRDIDERRAEQGDALRDALRSGMGPGG